MDRNAADTSRISIHVWLCNLLYIKKNAGDLNTRGGYTYPSLGGLEEGQDRDPAIRALRRSRGCLVPLISKISVLVGLINTLITQVWRKGDNGTGQLLQEGADLNHEFC